MIQTLIVSALVFIAMAFNGKAQGQETTCTFAWEAPIAFEDGTPVASDDITGYVLYRRVQRGTDVGALKIATTTQTTVQVACATDQWFVVRAVGPDGRESLSSNEVRVRARLRAPLGLLVRERREVTQTIVPPTK